VKPGAEPVNLRVRADRRASVHGTRTALHRVMKTVVVGIDTSERASAVLSAAFDLAERIDAKLVVVRATALPHGFPAEALSISNDGLLKQLIDAAQASLDRDVATLPRERLLRADARIGSAWEVICDVATETKAEIVVVGTHGHGPVQRMIGTTAARVVNHAPCSVLTVRVV
jgi:nucleotide-binding universal stress UspA family protein